MAIVFVVDVVTMLNRGVTAGLVVNVSTMLCVLGVLTAFMLVPMRAMLGVLVAVVHVISVAFVLHGGMPAIRAMLVTAVIGMLLMRGLCHRRSEILS